MKEELARIHRAREKKAGTVLGVDLEAGETVEVEVRRSRKGLVLIWIAGVVAVVVLSAILVLVAGGKSELLMPLSETAMGYLYLLVGMLYLVVLVSGLVGTVVYRANYLIVTNKRVIQRTTTSLFARSLNVISLSSVEDVSFAEKNVFDRVFHLGTVRMATVGEETTYTLNYVDAGGGEVQRIVKLLHKVKDGSSKKA